MNPTSFCTLSNIINAATSLILGFTVLVRDHKSKLHQLWWWMSLAIGLWATGLSICFGSAPHRSALALLALRFADTVAIFIPLLYLHFIIVFLGGSDRNGVLRSCYVLSILLACFGFSPIYIPSMKTKMGIENFTDAGPLFLAFAGLYLLEPAYALRLLWKARQGSTGRRRMHITYVMAAGVVGFSIGAAWFPLCFNIPISPLWGCFVWLYCLFVTWAVFKHQLFDICVVIRRSLVYSMLVTLLTVGYFGLVYGIESFFRATFGYRSVWLSLLAFALMALVFQPLKIGIQRLVDLLLLKKPHEEMVKQLERLQEEAQQADRFRAIATLAAGLAHEIKNPLTAIKTFAEFIPEKRNDPEFLGQLHEILTTEAARINNLVTDLLRFARPKPPDLKPIDLGSLLASTITLLSAGLLKRHIKWTVDCRHNGATPYADADQLRQALINLIQNATDAMPEGGTLTLTTQANNGHLEILISDTGHGIPKKLLSKIFDPFVTTKEHGTGLGLTLVHSIIQAHRGSIRAESTPGRGTTFTIELPI